MSATHTLSLEKLVRDEIDSWKITNNQNGSDVQNAKDLLYGIGLRVTEEVLDELKEYVDFSNFELYLDKHLNPAFEEFKKHYICWHYINSGFKTREAANAAGYGNSEKHKQQAFWQAASNAGLKLKEVINNPESHLPYSPKLIISINNEKVLEETVNKISEFVSIVIKSPFGDFLDENKEKFAEKLTANAEKILVSAAEEIAEGKASVYSELPFYDYLKQKCYEAKAYFKDECLDKTFRIAYQNFRKNYVVEQFFRCECNAEEAGRRTGFSSMKKNRFGMKVFQVMGFSFSDLITFARKASEETSYKSAKLLNFGSIRDYIPKAT